MAVRSSRFMKTAQGRHDGTVRFGAVLMSASKKKKSLPWCRLWKNNHAAAAPPQETFYYKKRYIDAADYPDTFRDFQNLKKTLQEYIKYFN